MTPEKELAWVLPPSPLSLMPSITNMPLSTWWSGDVSSITMICKNSYGTEVSWRRDREFNYGGGYFHTRPSAIVGPQVELDDPSIVWYVRRGWFCVTPLYGKTGFRCFTQPIFQCGLGLCEVVTFEYHWLSLAWNCFPKFIVDDLSWGPLG